MTVLIVTSSGSLYEKMKKTGHKNFVFGCNRLESGPRTVESWEIVGRRSVGCTWNGVTTTTTVHLFIPRVTVTGYFPKPTVAGSITTLVTRFS